MSHSVQLVVNCLLCGGCSLVNMWNTKANAFCAYSPRSIHDDISLDLLVPEDPILSFRPLANIQDICTLLRHLRMDITQTMSPFVGVVDQVYRS